MAESEPTKKRFKGSVNEVKKLDDPLAICQSIKKLRFALTDAEKIAQFRQNEQGLINLIVLLKRFSTILISQLNNESNNLGLDLKPKNAENLKIHAEIVAEILALLANCCHFDEESKFIVKNSPLLGIIVNLLQIEKINDEIVSAVFRLLGNVVNLKECSICILQTKSLINTLIHWMNKQEVGKLEKTGLNPKKAEKTTEKLEKSAEKLEKSVEKPKKFGQTSEKIASNLKIFHLSLRFFRRFAVCSKNFAKFLIKTGELAYHLAKTVNPCNECFIHCMNIRQEILTVLLELGQCKESAFAEQLVLAQCNEEILNLAKNGPSPETQNENLAIQKVARDLFFLCLKEFSEARIDFSKFGALEYVLGLIENVKLDVDGFKNEMLSLLCKFCKDAFTRVKLRETGGLTILLNIFIDLCNKDTHGQDLDNYDLIKDLLNSFTCFLYDENGLDFMLKYKKIDNDDQNLSMTNDLMTCFALILSKYATLHQCPAKHSVEQDHETSDMEATPTADNITDSADQVTDAADHVMESADHVTESMDHVTTLYRADSPTYKRLKRVLSVDDVIKKTSSNDWPLCKDFFGTSGGASPGLFWQSASNPGSSSPGGSWSPANSTFSRKSPGSTSDAFSFDDNDNGSSMENWETMSNFTKSEWFNDLAFAKNVSKSARADALCECNLADLDDQSLKTLSQNSNQGQQNFKYLCENTINSLIVFLSTLSHNENFDHFLLAQNLNCQKLLIESVLEYVSKICRPQPRAGRMLKRLARNRNLTEKLLHYNFHRLVRQNLCKPKCKVEPICSHCRKLCKIGCDILLSFRYQLDSDFGAGILAYDILNSSKNDQLRATFAIPYLIRTESRRTKFLIEFQCLNKILDEILTNPDIQIKNFAFDSLKELVTIKRLKDIWTMEICTKIDNFSSNECQFLKENSQKFENFDQNSQILFISEDNSSKILVEKEILIKNSSFYKSMFSGYFEESKKSIIKINIEKLDNRSRDTFQTFEIFLHFLSGCRKCPKTCLSIEDNDWHTVIHLLQYADQNLRPDLYDYIVKYRSHVFLNKWNLSNFFWSSLLKNDENLLKICIIFWLLFCDLQDLLVCLPDFCNSNIDEITKSRDDLNNRYNLVMKNMLMSLFVKFV